jgi:hypothetical protein
MKGRHACHGERRHPLEQAILGSGRGGQRRNTPVQAVAAQTPAKKPE